MGAMLGSLCNVLFCVLLALNTSGAAAWMKFLSFLPMSKQTLTNCGLFIIRTAWMMALKFSPWIRFTVDDKFDAEWESLHVKMDAADGEVAAGREKCRPVFVLGNHSSFIDVPISTVVLPNWCYYRVRTYMAAHLFKLPVLSTICRIIGHYPVHFSSDQDGVFKVDATKMEIVEKQVDEHLEKGGFMTFFPEGQVNKKPDTILNFRYGGMKRMLGCDARVALMVMYGNSKVWPAKAQAAGYPGRVMYGAKVVAPDGVVAYLKSLRDAGLPEEDSKLEDHELLAKYLRQTMQEMYDSYKHVVQGSSGKKTD